MAAEASTALLDEYTTLFDAAGGAALRLSETDPIGKNDVLLVIDMQNDFLPASDAPDGGRFGVAEGGSAVPTMIALINKFTDAEAVVVATRDYHPVDHCSFDSEGGPFPSHCVQGSVGSKFFPPIGEALTEARKRHDNVHIVFKGFFEEIDSFGAFKYAEPHAETRLAHKLDVPVSCGVPWTGAFKLKQSNLSNDIDAPPDVLSVTKKVPLADLLRTAAGGAVKRIFVVGLALDFCVLDTALTAAGADFEDVIVVLDASRAAHIPGVGSVGSGFLTDPKTMVEQCADKVKFVNSSAILG
uniref:nicotinamidase n=1 Tax=Bicosoecida sp. CB-2014 TaxID=1486930 RepID=A0A7S1CQX1_9STRA